MTNAPPARLRFGTFEFDPQTRELRRDGAPVRLQAQPAELLAALLAASGETVSRQALRDAIWGSDTHVDFESGLNFCIAQLRGALGDSAESPLYIKTVPKRGYQFIAPVTSIGPTPAPPPKRHMRLAFPLLAALAILGGTAWYGVSQRRTNTPSVPRIAVTRFENQSGDPKLDSFTDGLSDAVVAEFTTTAPGAFEIIGNAAILRQSRNRQDLARIAEQLNAGFVVIGQVQRDAGHGRVLVHLIRLPDQAHLWVTRVDDPEFADALRTQRDIARRAVQEFRTKPRKGRDLSSSQPSP